MDQPQIQELLESLVGTGNKVYFQPPANVQMTYPCIVYERDYEDAKFANNKPYSRKTRYKVTVIDQDPTSSILDKVKELPLCTFNRFFAVDNLNHDIYNVYF